MAIIKGGNGGSLSGLVGSVVLVKTKWGTYMRSAPQYSKSSWTENQKGHRQRFKLVNAFCNQFKYTVIYLVWNDVSQRASGHARFLKANLAAFSSQGELISPALLQLSAGPLEFPQGLQLSAPAQPGSPVEVSWPEKGSGIGSHDELMVVSGGQGKYSDILNTGILRRQKGGSFSLPVLSTEASELYLFFGSKDRKSYSKSECFALDLN